jgi:hypothetical protein
MNWSDETVEKVAKAIFECDGTYGDKAKAALDAVVVGSEVKALVRAALDVCSPAMIQHGDVFVWETANIDAEDLDRLGCALRPFTEASNG